MWRQRGLGIVCNNNKILLARMITEQQSYKICRTSKLDWRRRMLQIWHQGGRRPRAGNDKEGTMRTVIKRRM